MPRKMIDISIPLENDVARRSAGLRPEHPLFRSQADRGRGLQVLPGPEGRGTARPRGLGDRVDQALDPLRHPSRRAVSLRLDHGPRQARGHDRRSAAGMVLQPGGQARLPAFRRRLCRDRQGRRGRAQAHRPHARRRSTSWWSTPAPARPTASPTTSSTGCGMGREATLYLLERGVRVTGTDGWSWDAPFVHTKAKYARDPRRQPDLGRPPRRPRDRLLPHREAAQSRQAAVEGILDQLLPGENPRRLRRLDARHRHPRLRPALFAAACDRIDRAARLTPRVR